MASPVLAGYNTASSGGSTASSLSFTKPSGVSIGDVLFIMVGSDDATNTTQFSINASTYPGWTKLGEAGNATVDAHIAIFYKVADNSVSENTVTIDAASSDEMQGIYGYITGATTSGIEDGYGVPEASSWLAPNPVMLQAGKDCLIVYGISVDGADVGTMTVSNPLASPPGTKLVQVNSGTSGNDNAGCYGTFRGVDGRARARHQRPSSAADSSGDGECCGPRAGDGSKTQEGHRRCGSDRARQDPPPG